MSDLPHVLFVTHRVPYPPDKGDRIRTYHLLRFLAQHARLHLAALADEPVSAEAESALRALCTEVAIVPLGRLRPIRAGLRLLFGGTASEGMFASRSLAAAIRGMATRAPFRAAVVSASSVAGYLRDPSLAKAVKVVDMVDVDSAKWLDYARAFGPPKGWLYGLEGRRLARVEREVCGWANAVTLVSEREAVSLREATGAANVHCVTNGVDLDYYQPTASVDGAGCVFVGALDYAPNVDGIAWFAKSVWPNLRNRRPDARLAIVGRNPTAAVMELASIPGVDVVGTVPDVRPHLASAAVVIAPLRIARGLQNKVLEAMASGKAVVASPAAVAGFGSERPPTRLASTDGEWGEAIVGLLNDPDRRQTLGNQGRTYAERYHNWADCLAPMADLLGLSHAHVAGGDS